MSIFDNDLVESSWIGLAYRVIQCTNLHQDFDEFFEAAFEYNWSHKKLKSLIKELNVNSSRLTEDDYDSIRDALPFAKEEYIIKYYFIIIICLLTSCLSEKELSDNLTQCLNDSKLTKGAHVEVQIIHIDQYIHLVIRVLSDISQRIDLFLAPKV